MRAGSVQNLLADQAAPGAKPKVGMGATRISWTDRHAATVVEVSPTGHRVVVQDDTATRTDGNGMSDAQSYEFSRDPNGAKTVYSRRKDGTYRVKGGDGRLILGVRSHYHDFSF